MTFRLKNGEYSYLESDCLGKGSFGKVYKGKITETSQPIAVKIIDLKDLRKFGEEIYQVITTEISVMIKLSKQTKRTNFPYIVKIYDCFRTQSHVFMILEYCGEGDLEGLLRQRIQIPEEEAVQLIYHISQSIQFIASRGIAHRDLKPQNIFIKKEQIDGKVRTVYKLGDFGFAAQKNTFSTTLGTYPYMAPELFQQSEYGTAVDIWALGVMAHQILFDEIYFIGKDQFEIKKKVLNNQYILKPSQKAKISQEMQDFIAGCLKKNPLERLDAKTIANHPLFKELSREQSERNNLNQLEHVNYVIKVLKQNITKAVLLKLLAIDLKNLVQHSDFGVIYLLKKAKFILARLLESLKREKCPFNLSNDIWFNFVKSNNLKDAIVYIQKESQEVDRVFTDYLGEFKIYMGKFCNSDQDKIHCLMSSHSSSAMFSTVLQKEMERWMQDLQSQKSEKKRLLAAECQLTLRMDQLLKYDFEGHVKKRKEIGAAQVREWLQGS